MTQGPADASSKLRLVLDYLPCEACLSKPVRDQELLCSICRRLDRDVEATATRRFTVLLERPAPLVAPPVPLPAPAETPVPAPVEEPAPVVGVDVVTEELVEEAPAAPPAPLEEVPAQAEATPAEESRRFALFRRRKEPEPQPEAAPEPEGVPEPEPAPEPAPAEAEAPPEEEPPAKRRAFGLFRRGKAPEAPAEAAEQEPSFDDVVGYDRTEAPPADEEPFEDSFSYTREDLREERPPDAVVPVADELDDELLLREAPRERPAPAPEPVADDFFAEEPAEAPREEVSVEPEGQSPWAPPEDFLLEDAPPARDEPPAEEIAWPNEVADREPDAFASAPLQQEEVVEMEVIPDDVEPTRWEAPPAEEEIVETEIVEMEVVEDEEPAALQAPPPPEPAPVEEPQEETRGRRGGFSSLFKRRKADEARAAPEPAPAPAPAAEAAPEPAPVEAAPPAQEEWPEPVAAPAPEPAASSSDLHRLRGFQRAHEEALAKERIESISHLSGHDPVELAERTGIDPAALASWVHVADLAHEVGVPLDAALALVAAGVEGPRGLRATDAGTLVDRIGPSGAEAGVTLQNVRRWKRRA